MIVIDRYIFFQVGTIYGSNDDFLNLYNFYLLGANPNQEFLSL